MLVLQALLQGRQQRQDPGDGSGGRLQCQVTSVPLCHGKSGTERGRTQLSITSRYVSGSLCSVMAVNHEVHRGTIAGEIFLRLSAMGAASFLDPWLSRESKGEAGPSGTQLAVKAQLS